MLSGSKLHTCRRTLKCAPGDTLVFTLPLWTDHGHHEVKFMPLVASVKGVYFDNRGVVLDGKLLSQAESREFARTDGFIDLQEMLDWFYVKYQHRDFTGFCIGWDSWRVTGKPSPLPQEPLHILCASR